MIVPCLLRRALAVLAACAFGIVPLAGSSAGEPFDIPTLLPLTGFGAFLGKSEAESLQVVEDSVNAAGGVRGRPIHFAVQDDGTNPQLAVQLTSALVAKKAPLILGGTLFQNCNAMEPLVRGGTLLWCFTPGIDPQAGSNIFTTFLLTIDLLRPTLRYFSAKGYKRIGFLSTTDATGQDAEKAIDEIIRGNEYPGETVVAKEHFNISDISVTAQLSRIKAAGAQAMIAWTTGTAFGTVLHGATDIGLNMPILTSTGNLTQAQMKAYASFMPPDVLYPAEPAVAPESSPNRGVRRAVATFTELLGKHGLQPDQGHALSYDVALLLVDAYRKVGFDATAEQLRTYLANVQGWDGIFGRYDFKRAPQRGLTRDIVVLVKWDPAKQTWVAVSKAGGAP
jgi:branched-chain amino acid transport system substrate-binding protein